MALPTSGSSEAGTEQRELRTESGKDKVPRVPDLENNDRFKLPLMIW